MKDFLQSSSSHCCWPCLVVSHQPDRSVPLHSRQNPQSLSSLAGRAGALPPLLAHPSRMRSVDRAHMS